MKSKETNPQQANSLDNNNSSSNITEIEDYHYKDDSLNSNASANSIQRAGSLQRRSEQFWVVSHKVQQMVDLQKFYEMALRKLFRDFDIDQNGFIDAPELCQLIANATGNAGVYQPLTMHEAELFLLTSIKAKHRNNTNVHDIVLEENKFIRTMMKYDQSSMADNLAEHALSTSATNTSKGGISTVGAHQRMTKKIHQFVMLAKRRLERRSVSLYQLFHQYSGTHYVAGRSEWVKDVVDINDLHHMMCDVANGRLDEEPTRIDVKQFIESMDSNGDNHLQIQEFLTYMMRGMVQSRASMLRFSERSSMHHAVCCFLMNVDARHSKDDDHISLDNDQMEDLLHEVRGILISNDLLGVARAMGGAGRRWSGTSPRNDNNMRRKSRNGFSPNNSLNSSLNSTGSYDTERNQR